MTSMAEEARGLRPDLTLGYYDKAKFTGKVDWHDVKLKYMFGIKLDDIKVGGKPLNICQGHRFECLITMDSGTSLGSVPPYAFDKLVKAGVPTASNPV